MSIESEEKKLDHRVKKNVQLKRFRINWSSWTSWCAKNDQLEHIHDQQLEQLKADENS
ncbi:protein SET-like [Dorcoceras hygrometricum]|uniref:Protein SET-like n=1 Tax=Dorcoceras hygrometricum TaxID=472368 RepID=A0A2Z7B5A1_9LAMI|nr:protein SET-like [Dorcoceras hygrometricum]